MSEQLMLPAAASTRAQTYDVILPQIESLIAGEDDLIANLANIAAVLKEAFGWHWVGFYISRGSDLVLGPFQGPLACTRIPNGKGVCGTSAARCETTIVPDVALFPGHIACSSLSRSEIVVPLVLKGTSRLVLDVDSVTADDFDHDDRKALERVVAMIKDRHFA